MLQLLYYLYASSVLNNLNEDEQLRGVWFGLGATYKCCAVIADRIIYRERKVLREGKYLGDFL